MRRRRPQGPAKCGNVWRPGAGVKKGWCENVRRPPSDEPRMEWAAGAGLWVTHSRCRHLLAGFHASARATWGWAGRGWGQTLCTPQLELQNQERAGLQELRVPPPLASPRTKFLMLTLSLCTLISKMGFINLTCPFPTLPGDCKQGEASEAGHVLSVWWQMQALAPWAKLQGLGCGVCV